MRGEGGRGQPGGLLLWWGQRESGLTGLVPQAAGLHGYRVKSPCPSPPPPPTPNPGHRGPGCLLRGDLGGSKSPCADYEAAEQGEDRLVEMVPEAQTQGRGD